MEPILRTADLGLHSADGGLPELREAVGALDEALVALRKRGETETTAQALTIRSRVSLRLADGRGVEAAVEAVDLLEQEPPGPALVAALTQLSAAEWLSGSFAEAIAAADRTLALAEELGLPEPARALGYRGMARAYLGQPGAIAEMERAFATLRESGAGRDAAVVQNNLAIARYPIEGVARSLEAFEAGIGFCRKHGLVEAEWALVTNCPGLLVELGQPDEALAHAQKLGPSFEAAGQATDLVELRGVELAIRVARGERPAATEIDWLAERGRTIGHVDVTTFALACAAEALATDAPERARGLLTEIAGGTGAHRTPYYARALPGMVRTALAAGDAALAERLVESLEPRYELDEHALCAVRAQLAEDSGQVEEAAALYADAAARWQEFGNVPERAHALLGEGRCLHALGRPEAEEPLSAAQELFASMGYQPAVAATEALLELEAV